MDVPGRLFLCARCRVQVVLCSHCDRGNRYCGRQCSGLSRKAARRESARRYQTSWRGRLAHAARSRRWRQRRRARGEGCNGAGDGDGGEQHNVTHQGCPSGVSAAPLAVWTTPSTSAPEPADPAPTLTTAAATAWLCRRCTRPQPGLVRQGFLRHGLRPMRPGWRHDHSP
jgi:hypothetical protein